MIEEFFRALFKVGVPLGILAYVLVWLAGSMNYLGQLTDIGAVEKELARRSQGQRKKKKNSAEANDEAEQAGETRLNPVHEKWLAFGGGFYGLVGLYTYIKVELAEIIDFIARYDGLTGLVSSLSVGMLVELFIDALMNFIVAIAWPAYWLGEMTGPYIWVWLAVAYGA